MLCKTTPLVQDVFCCSYLGFFYTIVESRRRTQCKIIFSGVHLRFVSLPVAQIVFWFLFCWKFKCNSNCLWSPPTCESFSGSKCLLFNVLVSFLDVNLNLKRKQMIWEANLLFVSLPVAFLAGGTAVRGLAAPRTSEYQSCYKKNKIIVEQQQ